MRRALALLAVLLVAPSAQAERSGQHVVSATAADGQPGSLRWIVEHAAGPGDTIHFSGAVRHELNGRLVIPARLAGLTIDGATATGGRAELRGRKARDTTHFQVEADRVTFTHLKLVDVPISFAYRGVEGVASPHVLETEHTVEAGWVARAAVAASFSRGVVIRGSRFSGRAGVSLTSTTDALIAKNTFELEPGNAAVSDMTSTGLHVAGNEVKGGSLALRVVTATVSGNRISAGVRVYVRDWPGGWAKIVENRVSVGGLATGIVAEAASRIEVSGNTVTGPGIRRGRPGPAGIAAGCANDGEGTMVVSRNTVSGARVGIKLSCDRRFAVRVEDNTVRDNSLAGLLVEAEDAVLTGNQASGNGAGVLVKSGKAVVRGGALRDNRGAGLRVEAGATASAAGVLTGGNGGPAIDLAPAGQTPNAARKLANGDLDWPARLAYDEEKGKLRGTSCPGCRVEVYEAVDDDENGEGLRYLGTVKAGAGGVFAYPAKGELDCPATGKVTVTATHPRGGTSELSEDVECSCIVSADFGLDGARVPRNGFINLGITVFLPTGATVTKATLTDAKTEKRPSPGALGSSLQWTEVVDKTPPGAPNKHDFFVTVTYREGAPDTTGPSLVWHYRVAYEPPKGSESCDGRLEWASP